MKAMKPNHFTTVLARILAGSLAKIFFTLILIAYVTACNDNSSDTSGNNTSGNNTHPVPQQLPHPVGDPTGNATILNIGPVGGTLVSDDGQLTLIVPPGALSTAVDLSVQPLNNTANGGVASAWRLQPEGQTFDSPVTLSVNVPDGALGNAPTGALGFASQRSDGHWRWEASATYDATAKTASVSITHFSDWSLVGGFMVRPPFQVVKVNETGKLRVNFCYAPIPGDDDLAALAYECDFEAPDLNPDLAPLLPTSNILRWNVDGVEGGNDVKGRVSWAQADATYTAPSVKPNPETVSVSADIQWKDKGLMVASGLVSIDPRLRIFKGTVHYTYSDTGLSVTLSGDVTWTELDGSPGTLEPTGAGNVTVNMDGCTPYSGTVNVQGGQLFTDVPADGLYSFTLGFDSVELSCGVGVTIPYSGLGMGAPCNTTDPAPALSDNGMTMSGSDVCNGASQTWSFSRTQ